MKKLLLTSGAIAILAGSQMGFAECAVSDGGPNATSASCESTVSLQIDEMVVLKGLDDYKFDDPGARGWDGTDQGKATIPGAFCVGTNNVTGSVGLTVSSLNDFEVQGTSGTGISYSAFLGASTTALTNATGSGLTLNGGQVGDLACAIEAIALNVEFSGTALASANVNEFYSDTITITVIPN